MIKVLIVTHGKLAEGIVNTLNMLIGDKQDITYINAYIDSSDFTIQAEDFLKKYQHNSQIIVFTDLYGGSVNQKFAQLKNCYSFHLITGFNLPLVLEVILTDVQLSDENLTEIIEQSKQEMQLVNIQPQKLLEDNQFFDD
ncbi:PTS sugar transporter subunit IIA [Gilliamella apis]|uniref:PTS sugar transporter subunit IIA n=1 Tax=Gilliamella apis TaxID=1970738 RepID=UPI00242AE21B|nr:PTS sugar transporter subunit IIA [Gilliamella apis]